MMLIFHNYSMLSSVTYPNSFTQKNVNYSSIEDRSLLDQSAMALSVVQSNGTNTPLWRRQLHQYNQTLYPVPSNGCFPGIADFNQSHGANAANQVPSFNYIHPYQPFSSASSFNSINTNQCINPVPSFKAPPIHTDPSKSTFSAVAFHIGRLFRKGKNKKCDLCTKSFENNSQLKLHMNTHIGIKPFICDTCGKCFTQKPNLIQHRRTHSPAGYSCPSCDRSFCQPGDRLVHVLTRACIRANRHLQQTPEGEWHCVSCGDKTFVTKNQAERHARQHEIEKGLLCPVCGQNFQGQKPNM